MEGITSGSYDYQCFTTDNGASTTLSFISVPSPSTYIEVVDSLQKAYPMVPFQKQRICLIDGVNAPSSWPSQNDKRDPGFFHDLKKWFHSITDAIGFTEDVPDRKREVFFGDVDLDQETVDFIMDVHKTPTSSTSVSKRQEICDGKGPDGCVFEPANHTCLMTTGCHDDWIPAKDSAICFYRVGWYDVRIGKPHLNCSSAGFVRDMLRETLPLGELTSLSGDDVDFQCHEGPNDTTNLAIGVPNVYGDDVNGGLNLAYPGVGFDLNICPKCTHVIEGPWSGASCRE